MPRDISDSSSKLAAPRWSSYKRLVSASAAGLENISDMCYSLSGAYGWVKRYEEELAKIYEQGAKAIPVTNVRGVLRPVIR